MTSRSLEQAERCRFRSDRKEVLLLYPVDTLNKQEGFPI